MTRTLALGTLVLALTGCGTARNFVDFPEDTGQRTKPYGGVRLAVEGIKNEHDVAMTFTWPFRLADVGLSAVGDTLTLPVTLPIALGYAVTDGINAYYFPKEPPTGERQSEWRRFWFNEPVSPPPAEQTGGDQE
jgi:hypothetical protein